MRKLQTEHLGILLICFGLLITSCKKDKNPSPAGPSVDDYDRTAMLTNYANGYIIPAYNEYKTQTASLKSGTTVFINNPTLINLQSLQMQWETTLLIWQDVAFLEFGPAAAIGLRGQTNIYPTDTTTINTNISTGTYNLQEVANYDAKGFQAIDYLINGKGVTNQDIVDYFNSTPNAKAYLTALVNEINTNATNISDEWTNSYATTFVNNSGSNAQGSAVSDIVNALNLHYETYIRKGKIGLPAGVFNSFSSAPMPGHVEALYYKKSLPFLRGSIDAMQKFIKGKTYVDGTDGNGLDDYLIFINAQSNGLTLDQTIDLQLNEIRSTLLTINDPLSDEVSTNNSGVMNVYQALQKLIPNLKVDMTDALGVLITYQDTDGD